MKPTLVMRQFVVEASLHTGARRVCGGVALCSMTPIVLYSIVNAFRGDDHFIHPAHMHVHSAPTLTAYMVEQ